MPLDRDEALRIIGRETRHFLDVNLGVVPPRKKSPSLKALRETFLDKRAMQAGAADGLFYTTEMLLKRETLKSNELVARAIQQAWLRTVPQASRDAGRVSFALYSRMTRTLYLALKLQADEDDFDPEDCMESLEEDWEDDAAGKDHLTYNDFAASWFQLADLNTEEVDAAKS
eukprot:3334504-Prymnesium_polylepis.1